MRRRQSRLRYRMTIIPLMLSRVKGPGPDRLGLTGAVLAAIGSNRELGMSGQARGQPVAPAAPGAAPDPLRVNPAGLVMMGRAHLVLDVALHDLFPLLLRHARHAAVRAISSSSSCGPGIAVHMTIRTSLTGHGPGSARQVSLR